MNTSIVTALLLLICVAVTQGRVTRHEKIANNRALMQDIDFAKQNLSALITAAGNMSGMEIHTLCKLNEWDVQYGFYNLYNKLLSFQIDETEVENLRNVTEITVVDISEEFSRAIQEPRNVRASGNLAWQHLDKFIFSSLPDHITKLQTTGITVWYQVIDLEEQIKNIHIDLKSDVDAITGGLSAMEQTEIKYLLENVKIIMDGFIARLRAARLGYADATNKAVQALNIVLNQVPT